MTVFKTLTLALALSVSVLTHTEEATLSKDVVQGYTLLEGALTDFNGTEKTKPNWKKAAQKLKSILKLLGSYKDMFMLKTHARSLLGTIWFAGLFGAQQNWKNACACLQKVAAQDELLAQKAEACLKLGIIYLIGNDDVEKDEARAENYLVYVTQQSEFPDMQAVAYTRLALKYAFVDEDFELAKQACKKAQELSENPALQTEAEMILGQIEEIQAAVAQ